ncbi:hypothetical protein EV127DRAFT_410645 [Xylaria flabelliformis]|nr:hypothetical protein EV127DRAFT_410645 [Xylaria flabelliformis]
MTFIPMRLRELRPPTILESAKRRMSSFGTTYVPTSEYKYIAALPTVFYLAKSFAGGPASGGPAVVYSMLCHLRLAAWMITTANISLQDGVLVMWWFIGAAHRLARNKLLSSAHYATQALRLSSVLSLVGNRESLATYCTSQIVNELPRCFVIDFDTTQEAYKGAQNEEVVDGLSSIGLRPPDVGPMARLNFDCKGWRTGQGNQGHWETRQRPAQTAAGIPAALAKLPGAHSYELPTWYYTSCILIIAICLARFNSTGQRWDSGSHLHHSPRLELGGVSALPWCSFHGGQSPLYSRPPSP